MITGIDDIDEQLLGFLQRISLATGCGPKELGWLPMELRSIARGLAKRLGEDSKVKIEDAARRSHNIAIDRAARLAESDDGEPTVLSEEIRSIKFLEPARAA
ncbi:MAG: hypothetical protein K0S56_559 [Microvirga sp.]|nr:hypothetical protein [Microvirga sp.]